MTVAYATLGPALSPGWVTSEKRIWRKHGLDVDLVYLGGGSRSVPALLSGSIQLFMGSDTAAYVAAIQGAGVESWVKIAHEDRRANPGRRTEYKPVLAG